MLLALCPDWLFPPSASKEIEDALRAVGKPVEFHVIEAPYGHDCFLLEEARQTPIIRQFLTRHTLAEGGPAGEDEGGGGQRGRSRLEQEPLPRRRCPRSCLRGSA